MTFCSKIAWWSPDRGKTLDLGANLGIALVRMILLMLAYDEVNNAAVSRPQLYDFHSD